MLRDREGCGALVLIPLFDSVKFNHLYFFYFIILPGFYLVTFVITKPGIDRDRKKERISISVNNRENYRILHFKPHNKCKGL